MMTRVDVFEDIFLVFLGLGTLVGIIVVSYTLYNAYKYRDHGDRDPDENLPTLGELPTGGGSGKKLFVSFMLSAIIVISLVLWTYGMLLYVEDGPEGENPGEDAIVIEVEGYAFGWDFFYENGVESGGEMVVPTDETIWIEVTAQDNDVWHAFGVSEKRVKADAIPGETDTTWFIAEEEGEYLIECFELCGAGHSGMHGDLVVVSPEEYDQWIDEQLTPLITLEDADGEPITENFELTLVHQDDDEHTFTYTDDDFENGEIEITDIEQGGVYDITIESTDDSFDTLEEELEIVDGPEQVYTLGDDDDEDEDEDDDEDETEDENEEGGDD